LVAQKLTEEPGSTVTQLGGPGRFTLSQPVWGCTEVKA